MVLLCVLMNTYYRPFIYLNKIDDFGIADIGNNFLFIPITYFIIFSFQKKFIYGKNKDILLHFFLLALFELLSFYFKNIGEFDFKDVLGLFIGSVLTKFLSNEFIPKTTI